MYERVRACVCMRACSLETEGQVRMVCMCARGGVKCGALWAGSWVWVPLMGMGMGRGIGSGTSLERRMGPWVATIWARGVWDMAKGVGFVGDGQWVGLGVRCIRTQGCSGSGYLTMCFATWGTQSGSWGTYPFSLRVFRSSQGGGSEVSEVSEMSKVRCGVVCEQLR